MFASSQNEIPTIVILGAGPAAIAAVESWKHDEAAIYLVDHRNHAGGMLCASNHSWIINHGTDESLPRPEGAIKKEYYARLMKAKAVPLLLSRCAGLLREGGKIKGVLLANAFGTCLLRADAVIDASEDCVAYNHLNGLPEMETVTVELNMELGGATAFYIPEITIPSGTVTLHRTIREGTVVASFHENVNINPRDCQTASKLGKTFRDKALQLLKEIRENVPQLQDVSLARVSELRIIHKELENKQRAAFARCRNLKRIALNPVDEPTTDDLDALRPIAQRIATELKAFLAERKSQKKQKRHEFFSVNGEQYPVDIPEATRSNCFIYLPLQKISCDFLNAKKITTNVLIAGGGTGGTAAMAALNEHGVPGIVVDQLFCLGGTTTNGGVPGAWHGYRKGAYARYVQTRDAIGKELHISQFCAAVHLWDTMIGDNIDEMRLLSESIICDVDMNKDKISSVLVCGPAGFVRIVPKCIIDTTGSAEVCALANYEYSFGGAYDNWIQTSSCWGQENWTGASSQFNHYANDLDVVDSCCYYDVLRGIGLTFRHNSDFHISPIYTQRESRRIHGKECLTVRDIIERRFTPDAIAVASCLCDSHGGMSSDILNYAITKDIYSPQDNEIHVLLPFGVFRPKKSSNVLVGGKAIAGSRDATALCRMNPDICNAGYAIGTVAAQFITRSLSSLDDVELSTIRKELGGIGVLPEWAFTPEIPQWDAPFAIRRLQEPDGYLPALSLPDDVILKPLKEYYSQTNGKSFEAALALAWHGDYSGLGTIAKELERLMPLDLKEVIDDGRNPYTLIDFSGNKFTGTDRTYYGVPVISNKAPGIAYDSINRIIITLSQNIFLPVADLILPLLERAWAGGKTMRLGFTPYAIVRKDMAVTYYHARLRALAEFFLKNPWPAARPLLTKLLEMPFIGGHLCTEYWCDVPYPQPTLLELLLASALNKCGSPKGKAILEKFREKDARIMMRLIALRELTYQRIPLNPKEWDGDEFFWHPIPS